MSRLIQFGTPFGLPGKPDEQKHAALNRAEQLRVNGTNTSAQIEALVCEPLARQLLIRKGKDWEKNGKSDLIRYVVNLC